MWDEPIEKLKSPNFRSCRSHKRRCRILTARRWPWKSESAKKCVTTYLPNAVALKKDGAKAEFLYFSFIPFSSLCEKNRE